MDIPHYPSVPHRPQSNDIERDVELVSDGLKVLLSTSGIDSFFFPLAGKMWSQLDNLTRKIDYLEGKTPYELRNPGKPFKGEIQPFGRNCSVVPSAKELSAQDKPEARGRASVLLGFHEKGGYMDGSYLIAYLSTMVDKSQRLTIRRTRDVKFPAEMTFPMRTVRDAKQQAVYDMNTAQATDDEINKQLKSVGDLDFQRRHFAEVFNEEQLFI